VFRRLVQWFIGLFRKPPTSAPDGVIKKTTPRICLGTDCIRRGTCFLYLDVNDEFPENRDDTELGKRVLPNFIDGLCQSYEREDAK
jgi:hypothetical protein